MTGIWRVGCFRGLVRKLLIRSNLQDNGHGSVERCSGKTEMEDGTAGQRGQWGTVVAATGWTPGWTPAGPPAGPRLESIKTVAVGTAID